MNCLNSLVSPSSGMSSPAAVPCAGVLLVRVLLSVLVGGVIGHPGGDGLEDRARPKRAFQLWLRPPRRAYRPPYPDPYRLIGRPPSLSKIDQPCSAPHPKDRSTVFCPSPEPATNWRSVTDASARLLNGRYEGTDTFPGCGRLCRPHLAPLAGAECASIGVWRRHGLHLLTEMKMELGSSVLPLCFYRRLLLCPLTTGGLIGVRRRLRINAK